MTCWRHKRLAFRFFTTLLWLVQQIEDVRLDEDDVTASELEAYLCLPPSLTAATIPTIGVHSLLKNNNASPCVMTSASGYMTVLHGMPERCLARSP